MAFQGKVALVTGAGSGMGQVAVRRLARQGAKVAAVDLNQKGLEETAQGLANVRPFACDVSDTRAVRDLIASVEAELGPIDRVVHAAGIMPSGLLTTQTTELILKVMAINYGGTVNLSMATLPGMLERRRGDLILFGSVAGWLPSMHFGAYTASKFAVVSFAEVLYHENRNKGVRIVCVCPPPVKTPLLNQVTSNPKTMDLAKFLTPDQVIDAIESGIEAGKFFVFPGKEAIWHVRARRFIPDLLWKQMHKIEGI